MQRPETNSVVEDRNGEPPNDGFEGTVTGTANFGSCVAAEKLPQHKTAILKERAARLAVPPEPEEGNEGRLEVVEFMLSEEKYALEVSHVREVYPLKDLTPVPCTPAFVLGIINVRGQVISVIDTRELFNLPKKEITDEFKVIVIKNRQMEFGLLTDRVVGERKIPLDQIESDAQALRANQEEYVRGVTRDPLIVLDARKILADEGIVVHQEVSD